jgi:alpha-galactosidase
MNDNEKSQIDPLARRDSVQIFQGTDDGSPAVISRKIAVTAPGEDFQYIVVAVGEGSLDVKVDGLPDGLIYSEDGPRFDVRIEDDKPEQAAFTGKITGRYSGKNEHIFTITASNAKGSVSEKITIRPQPHLLPTPPMGWLSWEFLLESVSQEKMMEAIDGMHKAGLAKYGYKYVVIDDGWQGERVPGQPLQPNEKFPDMKALSDYAREKGFILGIYTTPWIISYAGYPGSGYHEVVDVKQFSEWGIGYLKLDYRPWDVKYLSFWQDVLREHGKEIAFSFSNNGIVDGGQEFLADITDIWRTGADIWGEWNRIKLCIYDQYLNVEGWKYFRKGHWPDPDMLQIGVLREGNEMPQNEQHFQVSLWAILPAPLLLSCDLNKLNDFHMSLLTNEEVIAVNQD